MYLPPPAKLARSAAGLVLVQVPEGIDLEGDAGAVGRWGKREGEGHGCGWVGARAGGGGVWGVGTRGVRSCVVMQ